MFECVFAGNRSLLRSAGRPRSKPAPGRDLARRFGIAHLQLEVNRVAPLHIVQDRLRCLEAHRLLLRIARGKLHHRSIRYQFLDDERGVLRLKRHVAPEGRNEHAPALGFYAGDVSPEDPGIASFNGELFDGDERPVIRTMMELDTLENASWNGEISAMRGSDLDRAVARFRQVLDHRILGERPDSIPEVSRKACRKADRCRSDHNEHLGTRRVGWGLGLFLVGIRQRGFSACNDGRRHEPWTPEACQMLKTSSQREPEKITAVIISIVWMP